MPEGMGLDCGHYKWAQTQTHVELAVRIPPNVPSRQVRLGHRSLLPPACAPLEDRFDMHPKQLIRVRIACQKAQSVACVTSCVAAIVLQAMISAGYRMESPAAQVRLYSKADLFP